MENRKFCDERCMKFVGRKPKDGQKIMEQEKTEYKAVYDRIETEGSFGRGKRRFGLNLIKMKLKETTMPHVSLIALLKNIFLQDTRYSVTF